MLIREIPVNMIQDEIIDTIFSRME